MILFYHFCALFLISFQPIIAVDPTQFNGELCYRDCNNTVPRICYYKWVLEHYAVLGPACGQCGLVNGNLKDCFNPQCVPADGFERGFQSINRMLPGPQIHVCKDDTIVVDVVNAAGGTAATLHWHGFHQRKTPWMDGVPFITQCPIDYATTFRYAYQATEAGTQFYHSHSGHHKVNGQYGGIVVRQPKKNDPNSNLYDYDLREHLIVVSDWLKHYGEMFFPGLRSDPVGSSATNILVNGKGTIVDRTKCIPKTTTPLAVFRVRAGQRYRFRLVNSMSLVCPAMIEIQNHSMTIIASDSFNLQPVAIDSLIFSSGERYDFVLNANRASGNYYMRFRAIGPCEGRQLEQFAILSYESTLVSDVVLAFPSQAYPKFSDKFSTTQRFLNHPNTTCGPADTNSFCITDLSSYVERPDITDVTPDYQFVLGFNNYRQSADDVFGPGKYSHFMSLRNNVVLIGAVNNISVTFPPFPPLTQPNDVKEGFFCNETSKPASCAGMQICPCIHRLKVKLNSIVELVIVDETLTINNLNHPFHLHGNQLFVTGMGQHPDGIPMTVRLARAMLRSRSLNFGTATSKRPIKDTISIPSKGYTIFRFKADNPGWWLLHCHFEWHITVGMGLVLQVGEPSEMLKPPDNFPKCNNYMPDVQL